MKKIPDAELIRQLQESNRKTLDQVFSYLYRQVYDQVRYFIRKYKGSEADTEDLFHDGLIALLRLARRDQLATNTNVEAYLFAICKNLWFKQLQKKKVVLSPDEMQIAGPEDELPLYGLMKKEEQAQVLDLLERIGEGCRKVLVYYYYDRLRMKKIAELMGYSSEQVAKNRKSECMKKLRRLYFGE